MNDSVLVFTEDLLPNFLIDFVLGGLIARRIRATWFFSHANLAVARLWRYPDLFELGTRLNFVPGSTCGRRPDEALHHSMVIVPETIPDSY